VDGNSRSRILACRGVLKPPHLSWVWLIKFLLKDWHSYAHCHRSSAIHVVPHTKLPLTGFTPR
jgi:hypothetical protein